MMAECVGLGYSLLEVMTGPLRFDDVVLVFPADRHMLRIVVVLAKQCEH